MRGRSLRSAPSSRFGQLLTLSRWGGGPFAAYGSGSALKVAAEVAENVCKVGECILAGRTREVGRAAGADLLALLRDVCGALIDDVPEVVTPLVPIVDHERKEDDHDYREHARNRPCYSYILHTVDI